MDRIQVTATADPVGAQRQTGAENLRNLRADYRDDVFAHPSDASENHMLSRLQRLHERTHDAPLRRRAPKRVKD